MKQTYDNYYRDYYRSPKGKESLAKARRKYTQKPEVRAAKALATKLYCERVAATYGCCYYQAAKLHRIEHRPLVSLGGES